MQTIRQGRVVCHLGKGLAVADETGRIVLCHTRRRLGDAAVGDRVTWEPCEGDQGRVLEILPRRSSLVRPAHGGRIRVVAANLDRVFVVLAPEPEPDWLLADQILAVCECRHITAALILNKIDLEGVSALEGALRDYQAAGYDVFRISTRSGAGLDALQSVLHTGCSMLSGQSGVGKSSLTNALLPDRNLRIGELSAHSGLGRHTTTSATLYPLPGGGELIDSPGVAVFGLAEVDPAELAQAYRDFHPHLGKCRFNDCRHTKDKGCAVREAVEAGMLSPARYERYLKLLERAGTAEFSGG
ncbi:MULTISPECIES: ribosome small subunit-dependent GTPase A [Methylococcus]|uniref:Small ribosomal subunit biogenesis GTPase RsgA n=1 Tax=Methylococcus capsulatus TaxID=414 RepID=A0ABZ2F7L0_METCP|nr:MULTISPECIES: ribosome small subunit-dependent GTPase A [Methylococcus]MDF9393487.1 ribosome small subunit-dependent GTPase A [Methylococcus capsulatus]